MLHETRRKGAVEGKPANRASDISLAANDAAAGKNSRADSSGYREKDRVAQPARRPSPRLSQDIRRPVAVDYDASTVGRGGKLLAKRVVLPPWDVGSPNGSQRSAIESRNANACSAASVVHHEITDALRDQGADRSTGAPGQRHAVPVQKLAIVAEGCDREL